jgi:hypothetical protein
VPKTTPQALETWRNNGELEISQNPHDKTQIGAINQQVTDTAEH